MTSSVGYTPAGPSSSGTWVPYNGGPTPNFPSLPQPDVTPLDGTDSQPSQSFLVGNTWDNVDVQAPNGNSGPWAAAAAGLGLSPTIISYAQSLDNAASELAETGLAVGQALAAVAPPVVVSAASAVVGAGQWVGGQLVTAAGGIYDSTVGDFVTSYHNLPRLRLQRHRGGVCRRGRRGRPVDRRGEHRQRPGGQDPRRHATDGRAAGLGIRHRLGQPGADRQRHLLRRQGGARVGPLVQVHWFLLLRRNARGHRGWSKADRAGREGRATSGPAI